MSPKPPAAVVSVEYGEHLVQVCRGCHGERLSGGKLKGGLHIATPDGTPMANAHLAVMHTLGFDDMASFGDSTNALNLSSAGTTTAAGA